MCEVDNIEASFQSSALAQLTQRHSDPWIDGPGLTIRYPVSRSSYQLGIFGIDTAVYLLYAVYSTPYVSCSLGMMSL